MHLLSTVVRNSDLNPKSNPNQKLKDALIRGLKLNHSESMIRIQNPIQNKREIDLKSILKKCKLLSSFFGLLPTVTCYLLI